MRVAVISTVKNEEADLPAFLRSIESQTRKPDIVVITSGRSDDRTDEILQEFEDTHYDDGFVWLPLDGGNRGFGRNEAIRFAGKEGIDIIACTNVSVLEPLWLEHIVAPIEAGQAEVVGGQFHIPTVTEHDEAMALLTQLSIRQVRDQRFVTALSMAFTVGAWRLVGGFPEELDTSEDTEFVRRLRRAALRFSYQWNASTAWKPSTLTLRGATKTYYQFAVTDGKAHLLGKQYGVTFLVYLFPLLLPFWLMFRVRKVISAGLLRQIPLALVASFNMDVARMVGYARGRLA